MRSTELARFAFVATAVSLVGVALLAFVSPRPSSVALGVALSFVPYAGLLVWDAELGRTGSLRWALGTAAVVGLVLVLAPPVLSDDVYRYLWDGRVLGEGLDPYLYAPDAAALHHLRDESWSRINNPDIPTIYPPVAQLVFAVSDGLAHAPWSMKLLALLAHLATVPLVGQLAGERAPRAMLLYALNPLALSESALSGHVDTMAGLAIAACVSALAANRPWRAAVLAAVAGGVKLVGLAIAPLVALRDRRAAALAVALSLLAIVPLVGAGSGSDTVSGLGQYARRWRGNEGPFVIVEAGVASVLAAIGRHHDAAPGHVRVPALRGSFEWLADTPLDPRAGVVGEKKGIPDAADFEIDWLAALLARMVVVAGVLALALTLVMRQTEPLTAARWVLLVGLLFAPQINPWYLLWLLPLELAAGRIAGVVWSALVLVAYAPLDGWLGSREWQESGVARALEFGTVVLVVAFESRWRRATPQTAAPEAAGAFAQEDPEGSSRRSRAE